MQILACFLAAVVTATDTYSDGNPHLRHQPFADASCQAALARKGVTARPRLFPNLTAICYYSCFFSHLHRAFLDWLIG